MIKWAKKLIYGSSQYLADKYITDEDKKKRRKTLLEKTMTKFTKAPDIINGESPWGTAENSLGGVSVLVYCYDRGQWENITACSNRVIGVNSQEIANVMQEKFNGVRLRNDYGSEYCFTNEDDANTFINDIAPYYDDYHLPRAMMDRMMFYDEGGYPPYFKNHEKCPNEGQMEDYKQKKSEELQRDRQIREMMGR